MGRLGPQLSVWIYWCPQFNCAHYSIIISTLTCARHRHCGNVSSHMCSLSEAHIQYSYTCLTVRETAGIVADNSK